MLDSGTVWQNFFFQKEKKVIKLISIYTIFVKAVITKLIFYVLYNLKCL